MSDYVLVSQGVEIARSLNPYEIIAEAIKTNKEWNKYVEKCIENCERYADNECFVYKEERDKTTEVDLFEFEHFLKAAREEVIRECITYIQDNGGIFTISDLRKYMKEKYE